MIKTISNPGIADPGNEPLKKAEMKMQANMRQHLRKFLGGIAVILISGIAIGSLPVSNPGMQADAPAELSGSDTALPVASPRSRAPRCAECGIIASTREIEGNAIRSHEITIRMQNGSLLVITDADPANWKQGERVTVLAGMGQ